MMNTRHANIPIFVPHLGCPNACVFCDQKTITGKSNFCLNEVDAQIQSALSTLRSDDVQIAFFGGSFTGIGREDMIALLATAKKYIDSEKVKSIRLSTRPDYIDEEILDILALYGVSDIELGIQSMSEKVLKACKRGHIVNDSIKACKLIKSDKYRFNLVGQMMVGLPASTQEDEIYTAKQLVSLGIDAARIYPTVVLASTELAQMTNDGRYTPLSVEEGAERAANILEVLENAGVPCIRCGLCATDDLSDSSHVLAGAYHPAMGEMAKSILLRRKIDAGLHEKLYRLSQNEISSLSISVLIPQKLLSQAIGQKKANIIYLCQKYGIKPKYLSFVPNENSKDNSIEICIKTEK